MVYDYVDGIADWKAAGLPVQGAAPKVQRVADATRQDVPTCTPEETISQARDRTFSAGWEECVVVDCGTLVVGRLRNQAWDANGSTIVEEVMEPGPTTVRPDGLLQPLVDRMAKRSTNLVTVTTPQGNLIGVLFHDEAERHLIGLPPKREWRECKGCPGQWTLKQLKTEATPEQTSA